MKKTPLTLALSLALVVQTLSIAWADGPQERPDGNENQQWQRQDTTGQQNERRDQPRQPTHNRSQQQDLPDRRAALDQRGESHADQSSRTRQPQGNMMAQQSRRTDPQNADHFAYSGHEFRQGQPAPRAFRSHDYRVNDWHARGLPSPPDGQHWSYIDGRYVLIAATTGIITSILLNGALHP